MNKGELIISARSRIARTRLKRQADETSKRLAREGKTEAIFDSSGVLGSVGVGIHIMLVKCCY